MVFEAHGISFPCTELLLFNYAKVNTVFHSMAPLNKQTCLHFHTTSSEHAKCKFSITFVCLSVPIYCILMQLNSQ